MQDLYHQQYQPLWQEGKEFCEVFAASSRPCVNAQTVPPVGSGQIQPEHGFRGC